MRFPQKAPLKSFRLATPDFASQAGLHLTMQNPTTHFKTKFKTKPSMNKGQTNPKTALSQDHVAKCHKPSLLRIRRKVSK